MLRELLGKLAGSALAPVGDWLKAREARKLRALELSAARFEAEMAAIREGRQLAHNWEMASIQNSGWKDEFWTLSLAVPLVGCFVPGLSRYMLAGFEVLEQTPVWYQYAVGASIAAAYGLRPMLKLFGKKK